MTSYYCRRLPNPRPALAAGVLLLVLGTFGFTGITRAENVAPDAAASVIREQPAPAPDALPRIADPTGKGVEVVTVGTEPYTGMTESELAKLAQEAAALAATPAVAAEPEPKALEVEREDQAAGGLPTPTAAAPEFSAAELVKLEELHARLAALPAMAKEAEPELPVPPVGNQQLTPQEIEKRDGGAPAPAAPSAPAAPAATDTPGTSTASPAAPESGR